MCVFPGDMELTEISNPFLSHVSTGNGCGQNFRVEGNIGFEEWVTMLLERQYVCETHTSVHCLHVGASMYSSHPHAYSDAACAHMSACVVWRAKNVIFNCLCISKAAQ